MSTFFHFHEQSKLINVNKEKSKKRRNFRETSGMFLLSDHSFPDSYKVLLTTECTTDLKNERKAYYIYYNGKFPVTILKKALE